MTGLAVAIGAAVIAGTCFAGASAGVLAGFDSFAAGFVLDLAGFATAFAFFTMAGLTPCKLFEMHHMFCNGDVEPQALSSGRPRHDWLRRMYAHITNRAVVVSV